MHKQIYINTPIMLLYKIKEFISIIMDEDFKIKEIYKANILEYKYVKLVSHYNSELDGFAYLLYIIMLEYDINKFKSYVKIIRYKYYCFHAIHSKLILKSKDLISYNGKLIIFINRIYNITREEFIKYRLYVEINYYKKYYKDNIIYFIKQIPSNKFNRIIKDLKYIINNITRDKNDNYKNICLNFLLMHDN